MKKLALLSMFVMSSAFAEGTLNCSLYSENGAVIEKSAQTMVNIAFPRGGTSEVEYIRVDLNEIYRNLSLDIISRDENIRISIMSKKGDFTLIEGSERVHFDNGKVNLSCRIK